MFSRDLHVDNDFGVKPLAMEKVILLDQNASGRMLPGRGCT
jgi:hypothetical protein